MQLAAAAESIISSTGNAAVHGLQLDLSSQTDVRRFAAEVMARFPKIHYLVCNAGVGGKIYAGGERSRTDLTEDGLDRIMAANYFVMHVVLRRFKYSDFGRSLLARRTFHSDASAS